MSMSEGSKAVKLRSVPAPSSHPTSTPGALIHINGCPGIGKLSIARVLVTLLRHHADHPVRLIHNHLLIDPAEATLSRTHPAYADLRKSLRQAVLLALSHAPSTTFIFTDFQSDNESGRAVCAEYKDAAVAGHREFVPVALTCGVEENVRRATTAGRLVSSVNKLVDPVLVEQIIRSSNAIYTFEIPAQLVLDTTLMEPEAVAELIAAHVREFDASVAASS